MMPTDGDPPPINLTWFSMRDYFAAAALTGLLAYGGARDAGGDAAVEARVVTAYIFADAMLAERKRGR